MIDDTIKNSTQQEITDVNLGFVEKRKFRINGDMNRILELDVSDLNVFTRLTETYPKLEELQKDAQKEVAGMSEEADLETLQQFSKILSDIDSRMRKMVDYIFATNASEICAPTGSMYDPVGGEFRYVHIIDTLSTLYTNGLKAEFDKMKNKVEKRTSKYTKKYHK